VVFEGDAAAAVARRSASDLLSLGLVTILISAFAVQTVLPVIHSAECISLIQETDSASHFTARAVMSPSTSSPRPDPSSNVHDPVSCPICWSLLHAGAAVASTAMRPVLTTQDLPVRVGSPTIHSGAIVDDDHPPRAPPFESRPLV
jgi:hypothetical protein